MKLSDFRMEVRNIASKDEPPKMGEFQAGSRGNMWGKGEHKGVYYQVKVHAAEPKWNLTDQKIKEKKDELKAVGSSDPDTADRLRNEIATLEKNRDKYNKRDKDSDDYIEAKKRLIAKIHGIGSKQLVCPIDFWAEPIPFKQNATFSAEAVPWIEQNVGFDLSKPIDFRRDLSPDEQYEIVASFCEELEKLHEAGVLHSDLKLGNTVVSKDDGGFKCSIIDYDSSIVLDDLHSRRYGVNVWYYLMGGTFFSPEFQPLFDICRENKDADAFNDFDVNCITTKSDIFSLGVTIYEYFYGEADGSNVMPFVGPDGDKLDAPLYGLAVDQDYKPNLPDTVNDLLYGAINWALAKDPTERPSAGDLAKVFRSKNTSLIPSKYTRNPLWEDHQGMFKLNLPDDISIKKAIKPRYRITIKGTTVTRSIDDLLRDGYAVRIGADGAPVSEEKKEPKVNIAWECDGGEELPTCIRRAITQGKYVLSQNGIQRGGFTYDQLKKEGYICTEEESKTPWPQDDKLKFTGSRAIYRNISKGPGYYLIGSGAFAIQTTKNELLANRQATESVIFKLCDDDAVDYIPNSDGIPSNIKGITRSSIVNHQYRLEHSDGRIEKIMIDEMVLRGYVVKK